MAAVPVTAATGAGSLQLPPTMRAAAPTSSGSSRHGQPARRELRPEQLLDAAPSTNAMLRQGLSGLRCPSPPPPLNVSARTAAESRLRRDVQRNVGRVEHTLNLGRRPAGLSSRATLLTRCARQERA